MWRWQSWAIGIIAVGVTAQVLAEDTAQPDKRIEQQQALQTRPETALKIPGPDDVGTAATGPKISAPIIEPPSRGTPPMSDARAANLPAASNREVAPPRVNAERPRYAGYGGSRYRSRYAGSNWPIDQNRRFEGPRDAFGGRWIYVRPARHPAARSGGRYGARYARYDDRGYAPRRPSYEYEPQVRGDQRPYGQRYRSYPRYD